MVVVDYNERRKMMIETKATKMAMAVKEMMTFGCNDFENSYDDDDTDDDDDDEMTILFTL